MSGSRRGDPPLQRCRAYDGHVRTHRVQGGAGGIHLGRAAVDDRRAGGRNARPVIASMGRKRRATPSSSSPSTPASSASGREAARGTSFIALVSSGCRFRPRRGCCRYGTRRLQPPSSNTPSRRPGSPHPLRHSMRRGAPGQIEVLGQLLGAFERAMYRPRFVRCSASLASVLHRPSPRSGS